MINNQLEGIIDQFNEEIINLGMLVIKALEGSRDALVNLDVELAEKIMDNDKEIDKLDLSIQSKWIEVMVRYQPVAKDLRSLFTDLKICSELERIGDHAAKIAGAVKKLVKHRATSVDDTIIEFCDLTLDSLRSVMKSYAKKDNNRALKIYLEDEQINDFYTDILRKQKNELKEDGSPVSEILDIIFIGKYFERIGDRIVSIARWISYNETSNLSIDI